MVALKGEEDLRWCMLEEVEAGHAYKLVVALVCKAKVNENDGVRDDTAVEGN